MPDEMFRYTVPTGYTLKILKNVNQRPRQADEGDVTTGEGAGTPRMQRTAFVTAAPAFRPGAIILLAALLTLAATMVGPAALADNVTCSACGKKIHGEYLVLDNDPYCSQACLDTVLPACAGCGDVIRGSHLTLNNKRYCSQYCLSRDLPACDMCGRPVQGNYFESKGKTYCGEACYTLSLPRCEACDESMKEWLDIEGRQYCHSCASRQRCNSCGHPGPTIGLGDGRRICDRCRDTAVMEQTDGAQLFDLVRRRMGRTLDLSTEHEIEFHLVGRDDLERISNGSASGRELGYYQYQAETTTTYLTTRDRNGRENKRVAGERTDRKFRIYILYGLPEKRLMEVAAHELAHDWMRINLPQLKAPIFEEGFAEYVAWLVNDSFGHEELKKRIEENSDPIYGDGFKMMKGLADRHGGFDGLIDYLADLP